MSSLTQYLLVTLIMTAGALVQGTIGFGMGLFAVPFLVLLNPDLVPGPILLVSGMLSVLMLVRERQQIHRGNLAWSLLGRMGGIGLAMAVLLAVPRDQLGLLFGGLILLGTGLTASGWHIPLTRPALASAGLLSGFMATVASIGGPPMALLYQREEGPSLRATLSAFFVVGTIMSLTGLHLVDRFGWHEFVLGLGLFPGIAMGFAISIRVTRRVDDGALRPVILGVCAITGIVVLAEALRAVGR